MKLKAHKESLTTLASLREQQLSKDWTSLASSLESAGRWAELVSIAPGPWNSLGARWQAALARAHVFLNSLTLAEEILKELRDNILLPFEAQAVALLAEAALERRHQRWAEARVLAERAHTLAKNRGFLQLEVDAKFAEAISYSEENRMFLAIDLMQSLRQETRPISPYRRGLAAVNEAWFLWDTGQWELMERVLPGVPHNYRLKIEVYSAVMKGEKEKIQSWIFHGMDMSGVHVGDLEQILMVLSEWQALSGSSATSNSWLVKMLQMLQSDTKDEFTEKKLAACLALCLKTELTEPKEFSSPSWRSRLEMQFLYSLSLAQKDPEKARAYYRKNLEELLLEKRIKTPLVPLWNELAQPQSPWSKKLSTHFGVRKESAEHDTLLTKIPSFSLEGKNLRSKDGCLSLEKSPTSLHLLRALAGYRGKICRKNELHFQLTKTAYKAELHEERLQKLLRRLNAKIEKHFGVKAWSMPGDNTVQLEVDLLLS